MLPSAWNASLCDLVADSVKDNLSRRLLGRGSQGSVYADGPGRAIKVTLDPQDAAVSLMTMYARLEGKWHPCLPMVADVFWAGLAQKDEPGAWVIRREAISSLRMPVGHTREWTRILDRLEELWLDPPAMTSRSLPRSLIKQAGAVGLQAPLIAIHQAIQWVYHTLDLVMLDLAPANFGMRADGTVVLRDMGGCARVPDWALEEVHGMVQHILPQLGPEPQLSMVCV